MKLNPNVDRRLFERALLIVLVATVIGVLADKARDLRARAEVGTFQYSLGAMRVALSLAQMQAAIRGTPPTNVISNPLLLLARPLPNAIGELSVADARRGDLPPGFWFHDSACRCIGYRPKDDRRLVIPSGGNVLVFNVQVDATQLVVGGGILAARENYLWWGEPIR